MREIKDPMLAALFARLHQDHAGIMEELEDLQPLVEETHSMNQEDLRAFDDMMRDLKDRIERAHGRMDVALLVLSIIEPEAIEPDDDVEDASAPLWRGFRFKDHPEVDAYIFRALNGKVTYKDQAAHIASMFPDGCGHNPPCRMPKPSNVQLHVSGIRSAGKKMNGTSTHRIKVGG